MEAGVELGLFLTTLVKTQTNVDASEKNTRAKYSRCPADPEFDRFARRASFQRPPATDVERSFRHSGWALERLRVRHALLTANVPASRYERFCDCGSDCVVEFSPSRNRHRTRANYCGDRFCLPCSRARASRVRGKVESLLGQEKPLLITLTVRNSRPALNDALNHLLSSFRRLRQQKIWRTAVVGGAAFVEVKKGARSGAWHPHLHVIAVGKYIPAKELSDAWLEATGDSFRVDIQRAASVEDGVGYGTKYATKGWTAEVVRDPDALVECILALRARRLCVTFGDWHNAQLEDPDSGPEDWKRIGTLDRIYDRFLAGEIWARGVMLSLMNGDEESTRLPEIPP